MCSSNGITPRDMRSCFHKMDPFGKGVCVTGDFFLSLVRVISDVEGIDVLSLKSSLRREVMELDELRKRFESVIRSMTLVDSELRRMPEEMINHSFEATKPEEQTISGAAEKEMFAAATAAALAGEGPAGAALTDTETLRRLQDENAWLHARLVEISKEMKVKQLAGSKSAVISLLQHEVRAHHEGESQYAAPLSPRAAAGMRSGDVLNMLEDPNEATGERKLRMGQEENEMVGTNLWSGNAEGVTVNGQMVDPMGGIAAADKRNARARALNEAVLMDESPGADDGGALMERIVTGDGFGSPDGFGSREHTSATLVLGPPEATGQLPPNAREMELEA